MGSLSLNLRGVGKGISAEVAFRTGLETIQEHISNLLLHGLLFKKKPESKASVLNEIKELT